MYIYCEKNMNVAGYALAWVFIVGFSLLASLFSTCDLYIGRWNHPIRIPWVEIPPVYRASQCTALFSVGSLALLVVVPSHSVSFLRSRIRRVFLLPPVFLRPNKTANVAFPRNKLAGLRGNVKNSLPPSPHEQSCWTIRVSLSSIFADSGRDRGARAFSGFAMPSM